MTAGFGTNPTDLAQPGSAREGDDDFNPSAWAELLRVYSPAGVAEMVAVLDGDVAGQQQHAVEAFAANDLAALGRIAHRLQGSCLQLGAGALAGLCADAERAAAARDARRVTDLLTQALARHTRLVQRLCTEAGTQRPEHRRTNAAAEATSMPVTAMRVLAAEDSAPSRVLLKRLLAAAGCTAMLVDNGAAAVAAASAAPYDLILMDVEMPLMDGLEATRRILALPSPQPPIYAVTASADDAERAACLAAGMRGSLAKPIRREALIALLSTLASPGGAP